MKIKCVIGSNLYELSDKIISFAKSEKGKENKIIVPDKFSLLAEILYFKNTKNNATFDTQVISVSKLAYAILNELKIEVKVLTSQQQALLVKKAIENCKEKLSVIKPSKNTGFYLELSKTISQLKSSKVDLTKCENIEIGKINDFKIIIEEYEKLREDRLDNNDLLTLLEQKLEKSNEIKNTRFFFAGFDSFTNQVFDIIKEISKYSDVTFGALVPNNKNLKSIYDLDIYQKANKEFDNIEIIMCDKKLNINQSIIENNLFSSKKQEKLQKNDYLKVFLSNNPEDEIDFIFKYIANQIKNGERASDYSVAFSSLSDNVLSLEEKANLYNLPIYIDQNLSLKDTSIYRFVENFFNLYLSNFQKEYVINFWFSYFVKIDKFEKSSISNIIEKYSLFNENFYKIKKYLSQEELSVFEILENSLKKIKECKTVKDICEFLKVLIKDFDCVNILIQTAENFKTNNDLKQEKLYLQVFNKFVLAIDSVSEMLSDYVFNLSEFKDDFLTMCESINISTVPISSNCIYIGDATDNFFQSTKYLFIAGACGDSLPRAIYDCGLVLDEDIKNVKELNNISPTINMINKRNKFKLYNLCLCPSQNLFISYSLTDEGKNIPCYFVNELQEIFGQSENDIVNTSLIKDFVDKQSELDYVLDSMINEKTAEKSLFYILSKSNNNNFVSNSLYNIIKPKFDKKIKYICDTKQKPNINQASKLFFASGKTKVTQIEKYFACPYAHFLSYGIKLSEKENSEIDSRDIGNVLHYVSQMFLNLKYENFDDKQINQFLQELFSNLTQQERFNKFEYSLQNRIVLKFLKDESFRLCKALITHQSKSNFVPFKTECFFSEDFDDLKINGVIDRIDKFGQIYRVIDYKSGNPDFALKDIYSGVMVQPAVYASIINKKFGKCQGMFLMPLKNQKSKENYKLKGFYYKDINLVRNMDKTINFENPSSNIIPARISTKKENRENNIIELATGNECYDQIVDYAVELSKEAVKEMKEGYINIVPYEKNCEYCKFNAICNFDKSNNDKSRKLDYQVKEESFCLDKNKGE